MVWYYNIVAKLLQLYIVLGTTLLCKHTTFFFAFWESFLLPSDYIVVPVAIGWFLDTKRYRGASLFSNLEKKVASSIKPKSVGLKI